MQTAHENMHTMFQFGHKILCDGRVTELKKIDLTL